MRENLLQAIQHPFSIVHRRMRATSSPVLGNQAGFSTGSWEDSLPLPFEDCPYSCPLLTKSLGRAENGLQTAEETFTRFTSGLRCNQVKCLFYSERKCWTRS